MKSKFILSSILALGTIVPAFGADGIITGGAGTCTVDVLGVSDNNATANTIATWTLNEYTLNPGQYLNVTDTDVAPATCSPGSYCVGGGYTVETANNSIAQCPTDYPKSRAGASADTQCYTACTTDMVAKATKVSGNDYYGNGTDTCFATECMTGYHVEGESTIIEKTPLIPVDYRIGGDERDAAIEINGETYSDYSKYGLTVPGTWAGEFDYGIVYGRASCQPKADPAQIYISENGGKLLDGQITPEQYIAGLKPLVSTAKLEFSIDTLIGLANGTTSLEDIYKITFAGIMTEPDANYEIANAGQYCYCQIDGFAPMTDGVLSKKNAVMYAPWVFAYGFQDEFDGAGDCAADCASYCAYSMISNDQPYDRQNRAALYGVLDYIETGVCTANTINIDWNPGNGGEHTKNMCTYDGEITLPTPDPVKPGYTFTGWKLDTTAKTE